MIVKLINRFVTYAMKGKMKREIFELIKTTSLFNKIRPNLPPQNTPAALLPLPSEHSSPDT